MAMAANRLAMTYSRREGFDGHQAIRGPLSGAGVGTAQLRGNERNVGRRGIHSRGLRAGRPPKLRPRLSPAAIVTDRQWHPHSLLWDRANASLDRLQTQFGLNPVIAD